MKVMQSDLDDREDDQLDLDRDENASVYDESRSPSSPDVSTQVAFPWSDQLQNIEIQPFTAYTGPKVDELDLDCRMIFFKLFFPDSLITSIKEQINLYAQQKNAPQLFKPVTDGDINLFCFFLRT